jgi:hypothetical protein
MQIKVNRELATGLIFVITGLFFLYFGRGYGLGDPLNMGPGFLPFYLSWTLVILGTIQLGRAWRVRDNIDIDVLRPVVVMASIAGFAYFLPWMGAIIGAGLVMLISAILHPKFNFRLWLISYLVVIALILMFKFLLGSTIPLWTF